MTGKPIRIHNKFGKRYISADEFCQYIHDLNLLSQAPNKGLLEYLERVGLLAPIARVHFTAEIARRFEAEKEHGHAIMLPVELDEERLDAANQLCSELFFHEWTHPDVYGEREHFLDSILPEHQEFIQKNSSLTPFVPWKEHRSTIWLTEGGKEIHDSSQYTPTYYHYWQVFAVASILRSGVNILYPLENEKVAKALWDIDTNDPEVRNQLYSTMNLEARHELNKINEYRNHFEAIAYFIAYKNNAFQLYQDQIDERKMCLLPEAEKAYQQKKLEIAEKSLKLFNLTTESILDFIGQQCDWWAWSRNHSTESVKDEYKENIAESIYLYRLLTSQNFEEVSKRIGRRSGYTDPILDVIFPDWIKEQRDLTIRSLKCWAKNRLSSLPSPFSASEKNIQNFCEWLEQHELYQYYWHFHRFADFNNKQGTIYQSAAASEAVSFANLIEMISNKILGNKNVNTRKKTFPKKLRLLFGSNTIFDLNSHFDQHWRLAETDQKTLHERLKEITALPENNYEDTLFKILLTCWAVRNEGTHLGLNSFDRVEILDMLETMAMGSLIIWCMKD